MLGAYRTQNDARWYRLALGALVLSAWAVLALWGAAPSAGLLHHDEVGEFSLPPLIAFAVFVAGWTLMTVAMMLPGSLPLVNVFYDVIRGRSDRAWLLVRLGAGYLSVWALFGAAAYLGDLALHEVEEYVPLLAAILSPGVLLAAGLYQFTPLKERCLSECRSPYAFVAARWNGLNAGREAWSLGLQHGVFCLGCCWVLMLLMFAVGAAHLGWMLGLGALMAAERSTSWGRRLTRPAGAGLIAWAAVLVLL